MVILIKRVFVILSCLLLVVSLIPFSVSAAEPLFIYIEGGLGNHSVSLDSGRYGYELTSSDGIVMASGQLVIQSDVQYYVIPGEGAYDAYYLLVYVPGEGLYVYTYHNDQFDPSFSGMLQLYSLPPTAFDRTLDFWNGIADLFLDRLSNISQLFISTSFGVTELTAPGLIIVILLAVPVVILSIFVIASFFRFRK